ncbi:MAG TPA: hypothetical protein VG269_17450 [Tepidisphaeraceae bacterium]|jgi:hypothetical protein|nr:hypothetical protein [Tepidisphaeraceae bacterium]
MIGSSVFAQLQSLNTSLSLGLSNASDGTLRIYPNYVRMPDDLYPAPYPQIVYDCQNYEPDMGLDGPAGTSTLDVKILCVAEDYDAADALAKQLATALDGTRGTWGATSVQGCFLSEVAEDHFVDTDMATILYYVKELTFKVCIVG